MTANYQKSGIVFDMQSFSVHDGPGIRTLIFLKGCPLKCLWCANPEGQQLLPEVRYHEQNCVGCLACAEVCPYHAITRVENPQDGQGFIQIDRNQCKHCLDLKCAHECPNNALQISGKVMTVDDIMKKVKTDAKYFRNKGGITLSGGDPLCQSDFALEILKACREEYIHTAIESELAISYDKLEPLIPYLDLFLCDIKHMDSAIHTKLTGVPNENILNNIKKLAAIDSGKILIRVPIIPTCNDSDENITAIGQFCREIGIQRVNILPYHQLGIIKFNQLGKEYLLPADLASPSDDKMQHLKSLIDNCGVTCVVG